MARQWRADVRKLLISVVLTLLTACAFTQPNAATSPRYAFPRISADRVIVFVHGIFGDTLTTWQNTQGQYFWEFFRGDKVYRNTNIYVYGFPSRFFSSSFTINEAVADLYTRLKNDDVFEHKQVLFVAHSMGGLVVEELLLRYRELASQVPLIFLISTPHEGAEITKIARYISRNPALETMLPGDKNQYLDQLDRGWRVAKSGRNFPTEIRCTYETQDTYGIRVVTRLSATRPCVGDSPGIDADHLTIVKPSNADSGAYIALRAVIKDLPFPLPPATVVFNYDVTISPIADVPTPVTENFHVDDGSDNCDINENRTAAYTLQGGARIISWGSPNITSSNCPTGASYPIPTSIRSTGDRSIAIDYHLQGCGKGPVGIGCNGRGWLVFDLPVEGIRYTPNVALPVSTWTSNAKAASSDPVTVVYDRSLPPGTRNLTWHYAVKLIKIVRRGDQIIEQRTIAVTHVTPTADGLTTAITNGQLTISASEALLTTSSP
jgi:pimeloyl-ACP methyl ester carboxylesterase